LEASPIVLNLFNFIFIMVIDNHMTLIDG
jgi:hypothetical protein